jgi:hypothetical protein
VQFGVEQSGSDVAVKFDADGRSGTTIRTAPRIARTIPTTNSAGRTLGPPLVYDAGRRYINLAMARALPSLRRSPQRAVGFWMLTE